MTAEQIRIVLVLYSSAIVPLLVVAWLRCKAVIPAWVSHAYLAAFVICALGWELWFSYGWIAGDPVYLRRAAALNTAIPFHLNWVLNSLADAGSVCLGGLLLVWLLSGKTHRFLQHWNWWAFSLVLIWFVGQNVFVEMFLYRDQLSAGKPLSWAPLAPTGPWFNPVLFEFSGRSISLQAQLPWLLMAPLFYGLLLRYRWRYGGLTSNVSSRLAG